MLNATTAATTIVNSFAVARLNYCTKQLTEVAGNQKATWRLAKELLHSDDRPPPVSPQHASKLC